MVRDDPSVLDRAAHAGSRPGCADCVWEVVLACPANVAGSPTEVVACEAATGSPRCRAGQQLYRLYLSTDAVSNRLEGSLCLGAVTDVVPVGNVAAADVERYLRDVQPPNMVMTFMPRAGIPLGLPAYVKVRPPSTSRPVPFGGPQVQETITLAPQAYRWSWGDGTDSGWTTDAGDVYPGGTLTHTYQRSGRMTGELSTRWGGTYTVTVAGLTFGPYTAIGTVIRQQPFTMTVVEAHSHLVSHS